MVRVKLFKTFLAFAALTLGLSFYSCSSDDDGPGDSTTNAPLVGKWEVSNQNAEYGSFEFTGDQKYIITQRTTTPPKGSRSVTRAGETYIIVIFGDYSAISAEGNEYKLDLKEFGTIVISITESGATITVNGDTYDASKAQEVTTNKSKTELLCHTWKLEKEIEDGEVWLNNDPGYRLVFTEAGTYFFRETEVEEPTGFYTGYGVWEWIDSKSFKGTNLSEYDENDIVESVLEIIKLTEKELVILDKGSDNGRPYECLIYYYR